MLTNPHSVATLLIVLAACAPTGTQGGAPQVLPPAHGGATPGGRTEAEELLDLGRRDQEIRDELTAAFQAAGGQVDTLAMSRLLARMDSADRVHSARLRELVQRHGWPTARRVGAEAAEAAFLVVQHASHDRPLQRDFLAHLERSYAEGEGDGQALALLTDRLRLADGRPQLYGTQASIENGQVVIEPIEDEAGVDARRARLGMPPMAEYIRMMRQHYGLPE